MSFADIHDIRRIFSNWDFASVPRSCNNAAHQLCITDKAKGRDGLNCNGSVFVNDRGDGVDGSET